MTDRMWYLYEIKVSDAGIKSIARLDDKKSDESVELTDRRDGRSHGVIRVRAHDEFRAKEVVTSMIREWHKGRGHGLG